MMKQNPLASLKGSVTSSFGETPPMLSTPKQVKGRNWDQPHLNHIKSP